MLFLKAGDPGFARVGGMGGWGWYPAAGWLGLQSKVCEVGWVCWEMLKAIVCVATASNPYPATRLRLAPLLATHARIRTTSTRTARTRIRTTSLNTHRKDPDNNLKQPLGIQGLTSEITLALLLIYVV